ncbi:MAG: thiamine-phosphate kinase [Candidatus Caldatribacterium sp.]|nr:thiamine-phosphate kinase [Candidatus Caldatribacterium sp.]
MEIRDLGEFGVIARIRKLFPGIGDDCAVLPGREGYLLLATVDSQVEETHFRLSLIPPFSLGRRLLVANLSDIAAMGGIPRYALTSFVLREDLSFAWFEEFLSGLHEEALRYGVEIVGGNLARTTGPMVLDLVLLGEVEKDRPLLLRSNARPGDRIFVTGYPGEARAGLLLAERNDARGEYESLRERFLVPSPRLEIGRFLGSLGERVALIDVSDGLLQDLGHILEESRVGAVLEREALPVSLSLARFCEEEHLDPLDFVLRGGEDFELLFALPSHLEGVILREIPRRFGVPVSAIGAIVAEDGVFLREGKELLSLTPWGFDHFMRREK